MQEWGLCPEQLRLSRWVARGSWWDRDAWGHVYQWSSISILTVPVPVPCSRYEVLTTCTCSVVGILPYPLSLLILPVPVPVPTHAAATARLTSQILARFRGSDEHGRDGRKDRSAECPSSPANSLAKKDARQAISKYVLCRLCQVLVQTQVFDHCCGQGTADLDNTNFGSEMWQRAIHEADASRSVVAW